MSAFIVSDDTINRIVDFCDALQYQTQGPLCYLKSCLKSLPTLHDRQERIDFGRALFSMNVAGVASRYGNADDMLPDGGYVYRQSPIPPTANPHQVLKSLDCYLYQCSEGDVPERELFKQLESLQTGLSRILATNSPQYEAAEWG